MALKKVLDKIDNLPEEVQKEYIQKDGKFYLDIDGDETDHLRQKKQIAEEHRTKAETKVKELQDQLDEIRRGNIPKSDVDALEASWKEKLTTTEQTLKDREKKLQNQLHKATIGAQAAAIASELFVSPDLLSGEVAKRLAVEETEDGDIRVRVKGADGKPSALSLDDLKNEIKADKRYAQVLIGSKASGGGANGNGSGSGGGGQSGDKKPHEMTDSERIDFYKRDPEGFRQAFGQM